MQPPFYCDYGANIDLGERVFFNVNCVVLDVCTVRIGDFTLFGPAVQIYTPLHPFNAERRRREEFGSMADLYREKVIHIAKGLEFEESRVGAAEALRGLIDAIVLTPEDGTLKIELQGNLAAMLKAAQAQSNNNGMLAPLGRWEDEKSPDTDDLVQIMLVAGACNRRYLQLWSGAA
jgi:hypothetical protein